MTKLRPYLPHLVALSGQLCFSGWHIVGSLALKDGANPFVFALYRELVGSLIMFWIMHQRHESTTIERSDYVRFLFLGACSFTNVVGAVLALQYLSATTFAIFQPAIPCIATIVSICVGMDQFTYLKLLGISLAVGGAVLAEAWQSGGDEDDDSKSPVLGSIIVSLQVAGMALLMVFVKPMLSKYPSSAVTFVYYTVGTLLTCLLVVILAFQFHAEDFIFDGMMLPWVALAYASVMATAYTYNALSWAGKRLSPGMNPLIVSRAPFLLCLTNVLGAVTVYSTFQPIGTILLSFVILGDIVTLSQGMGAVLVIAGLATTVYGSRLAGEEGDRLLDAKASSDQDEEDRDVAEILFGNNLVGSGGLYAKLSVTESVE